MPFEKGRAKTGGRKKGSKPTTKSLRQGLQAAGFDLTQEFLTLFRNATDPGLKFQILKEMAKHTQPPAPKEEPDLPTENEEPAQVLQLLKDDLDQPDE